MLPCFNSDTLQYLSQPRKNTNIITVDPSTTPAHAETAPLQSKDHRDLLDIIDKLPSQRIIDTLPSQRIGQFVDLPQIIVCGDQSSDKSSALEAISRMTFPPRITFALDSPRSSSCAAAPWSAFTSAIPSPERLEDPEKEIQ
jgi:hypothetical protein